MLTAWLVVATYVLWLVPSFMSLPLSETLFQLFYVWLTCPLKLQSSILTSKKLSVNTWLS